MSALFNGIKYKLLALSVTGEGDVEILKEDWGREGSHNKQVI